MRSWRDEQLHHFPQTLRHFHRLMPEYGSKLAYGAVAYLKAGEGRSSTPKSRGLFVIRADRRQRQHHQSGGVTPRVFAP